jgi:hypothetical protein
MPQKCQELPSPPSRILTRSRLVTKFDILIRAKRNGLERPSERALQSLTGVRIEPAPVAENDAFWLP